MQGSKLRGADGLFAEARSADLEKRGGAKGDGCDIDHIRSSPSEAVGMSAPAGMVMLPSGKQALRVACPPMVGEQWATRLTWTPPLPIVAHQLPQPQIRPRATM
jgi:hypothetical protein